MKIEGFSSFVDKSLETRFADVLNAMPARNPNRHLLLDAFQRRLVHNAMALGRALRRKVRGCRRMGGRRPRGCAHG